MNTKTLDYYLVITCEFFMHESVDEKARKSLPQSQQKGSKMKNEVCLSFVHPITLRETRDLK